MSVKKGVELGLRRQKTAGSWVQVERKALELWGQLAMQNSGAAQLMAVMISHMKEHNALVASQKTLAELTGCSVATIKRRLKVLKDGNWIEVRQMGAAGTTNAYIVNDRVAWQDKREGIRYSLFSAAVLLSETEQDDALEDGSELQNLPNIFPNEMQIPSGDGLDPPSSPAIPGLEHDLPARQVDPNQTDLEEFTGKPLNIDRETGEVLED